MRKTLLIAAAALAASVISSQAQVYSQNIVGYVNVPVTAGTFSLQAPALDADGTGTNNTLASLYPNPTIGDNVLTFNPTLGQYVAYQYLKKTTGVPPNQHTVTNWYDPNAVIANTTLGVLNPGQAIFYSAAVNETNTYVGVVLQGTLTNKYLPAPGKYNLVSSMVPISGGITTALGYAPNVGDSLLIYTNGGYVGYQYLKKTTGVPPNQHTVTNWYNPNAVIDEPSIQVGQGFFINPGAANTWVQVFTNN